MGLVNAGDDADANGEGDDDGNQEHGNANSKEKNALRGVKKTPFSSTWVIGRSLKSLRCAPRHASRRAASRDRDRGPFSIADSEELERPSARSTTTAQSGRQHRLGD